VLGFNKVLIIESFPENGKDPVVTDLNFLLSITAEPTSLIKLLVLSGKPK
jgi:hypothetical protein